MTTLTSISSEAVYERNPETGRKLRDIFSREEIGKLTAKSDLMGFWAIIFAWGGVAVIMAMMSWAVTLPLWYSTPLILIGMLLLAGRQLALSINVHDASHATLFKTRWLNTTFTDWVCARPLWNDLAKYRAYHFIHHTRTGTDDDPDLILRSGYPTTRTSMLRKFIRDLLGVNGLKYIVGRVLMDAELLKWTVTGEVVWLPRNGRRWYQHIAAFLRNFAPTFGINLGLALTLASLDHLWLYGLWVLSHLTIFMAFMRVRSMAEHAATERVPDMFRNTRTVSAGWLARALFAPIGVNFHQEHHLLASCPYFRLKKAHHMLRERGVVDKPPSYWQMMQIMMAGKPVESAGQET